MNLKDLKNFITYQIDDRLAECGIDSNQIIQIKIQDRKLPPDDNVVWNVVWKLKTDNLDYLDVLARIEQWINNEIIFCYMNDNLDRDLSIEIVWRKIMNLRELHEYISTFDFRQYGIEQIDFVEIRSKDGKVVYHINTQGYEISKIVKSLQEWIESQIVYCYLNRKIREFSIEIMGHDAEKRIACIKGM